MTTFDRHLELLAIPALAARIGISTSTLRRRTDVPPPVMVAGKKLYLVSEVRHLFRPDHRDYQDAVGAPELATLLQCGLAAIYTMTKDGRIPRATRGRGRSTWSRRDVEEHLKALRRSRP